MLQTFSPARVGIIRAIMSAAEQLLQAWRLIFQEGIQLCDGINQVPDACACKDADQHLDGQCDCKPRQSQPGDGPGEAESCSVILARLRADLTLFSQDFGNLAVPLANPAESGLELRRDVFFTITDLQRIMDAVERLDKAVVGFRRTCDLLQLHRLKQRGVELREHLTQLNKLLDPPTAT